jgi:pimeloyl-ACP methyl ester carboxylesterase
MDVIDETTEKGVTERRFDLKVDDEVVPGILWEPEEALAAGTPRPTILIGHGGTQHKRVDTVLAKARQFVRHLGVSVAALDAPGHGERVTPEMKAAADAARERLGARIAGGRGADGAPSPMEMSAAEAKAWVDRTTRGVAEWKALLNDLQANRPDLAAGPFGYWGVSMGTMIGLPFVGEEPRITAAVLGLAGLSDRPGSDRFEAAARGLSIPVLFLFQADDELMTLQSGIDLFLAFGSKEKTMHLNPGGHVQMPPFERVAAEDFFRRHLLPSS